MMSYLSILFFLFFAVSLHAAPASESEKVRRAIDNICGDTWCEGDYSFQFKKVVLDERNRETRIFFNMTLRGYSPRVAGGHDFESNLEKANFEVNCVVKGFFKADEILAGEHTVKWEFYTPLSACVQSLEAKVHDLANVLYGPLD